jgi:hypothetical protein
MLLCCLVDNGSEDIGGFLYQNKDTETPAIVPGLDPSRALIYAYAA